MTAQQQQIRNLIADLELNHGVAVALPITEPLVMAYDALGKLERSLAVNGPMTSAAEVLEARGAA